MNRFSRFVVLAPADDLPAGGGGGGPPAPPPAPANGGAPPAPTAKPDHTALVAGIQQRRAAREAARKTPPPGTAQLPKDVADKVGRWDAYEASEKAKQDAAAKKLTPEAKAVYDSIPDLQARRAFLDFSNAKAAPPAPANAPPGAGGGGGPPAASTIDVPALCAEKGIDFVKKNHPEAFAKYAENFGTGGKTTSLSSVFLPKKKK